MNYILEDFARSWILDNVKLLKEGEKNFLKRILEVRADNKEKTLEELIKIIDKESLSNIMMLIERTLKENENKN